MRKLSTFTIASLVINVIMIPLGMYALYHLWHPCPPSATVATPVGNVVNCCPDNMCYPANCDMTTPFNTDIAVRMIHRYRINHWEAVNKNCPSIINQNGTNCTICTPDNPSFYNPLEGLYDTNKIDARSAWFSLETLKKFIHTIESQTCNNKPASCPVPRLGVRIYYAEYPTTKAGIDSFQQYGAAIDYTYAGLHTLLMIPTFDLDSNVHVDFDPSKISTCPLTSVFDSAGIVGSTITALSAQNHGGLAPPPVYASGPGGYWTVSGAYFMRYVDMFRDCYRSPNNNATICPTPILNDPLIGRP